MDLNARTDLFFVQLPKTFFPEEVTRKFNGYLERLPRVNQTPQGIVNDSIQSITIPNLNYEPAVQTRAGFEQRKRGDQVRYRSGTEVQDLYDNTFTITMRAKDGHINYWIMLDLFRYHYSFPNPIQFIFDLPIAILDSFGNIIFTVIMKKCLFTGMSEYELNFSNNTNSFKSFDCTFAFNELDFEFLKT